MVMTDLTSVSGVRIGRYTDAGTSGAFITGYYYVVEALGDQFTVHTYDFPTNDASTGLTAVHPNDHDIALPRTMFIGSYKHEEPSFVSANAAYRLYSLGDERLYLNISTLSPFSSFEHAHKV